MEELRILSYKDLEKLFLSGYPLNKWCWKDLFDLLMKADEDEVVAQHLILNSTVNHHIVQKYPLKMSYQRMFLKKIINKLEEEKKNICDELYESYCHLLNTNENSEENEVHFRHYIINEKPISLRESDKLISEGTTGLHSWQASMALAEWCVKHQSTLLKGKNILELGSGVGLTGLACILGAYNDANSLEGKCTSEGEILEDNILSKVSTCFPKNFTFSDCHPSVLHLLKQNVQHNIIEENICDKELEKSGDKENILLEKKYNYTKVRVIHLAWEDVNDGSEEVLAVVGEIDYVIAADVVYDHTLFSSLIGCLKKLLMTSNSAGILPSAILACTKRDSATLQGFLDQLGASGLEAKEEGVQLPQIFFYDPDPPTLKKMFLQLKIKVIEHEWAS